MNPNGPERRNGNRGRRREDSEFCHAHSGMEANIGHLTTASEKHSTLLEKIALKTNGVLVSCILLLLGVVIDLVLRLK